MTDESTEKKFPVIRRVANGLRYRSVDALIGQIILVSSIGALEAEIQEFVHRSFADCVYLGQSEKQLVGALWKYGILDFKFQAPDSMLNSEFRRGIPIMIELGFLSDFDESLDDDDRLICLEELDRDVKKKETFLKLFFEDNADGGSAFERYRARKEQILEDRLSTVTSSSWIESIQSEIPFPIEFRVIDACVTNSDHVWINRHFFL